MPDKSFVNTVSHLIFEKSFENVKNWELNAMKEIYQSKDWRNKVDVSATDVEGKDTFPETTIIWMYATTAKQETFG